MLFSIIIPAYNAEKYLLECLASVDAQIFRDYEVVIVDDAQRMKRHILRIPMQVQRAM